jgi:hypothetical protein
MKIANKYRSKQLTPEFIEQASKAGLKFEMYLVPSIAKWIIELIADGSFLDPSDALFNFLNEFKDFVEHKDLRSEVFKRTIQKSLDNINAGGKIYTSEELSACLAEDQNNTIEPAVWVKDSSVYNAYIAEDGFIHEGIEFDSGDSDATTN